MQPNFRTEFEARTGAAWSLNIGQAYTTLQRLERDSLIERTDDSDSETFKLTDAGAAAVADWWQTPVKRPRPARDELAIKLTLAVMGPSSSGLVGAASSIVGALLGVGLAAAFVAVSNATDSNAFPDLRVGWLDLVLTLSDQETDPRQATRARPLIVAIGAAATVATGVFALIRNDPPWLLLPALLGVLTLVFCVRPVLAVLAYDAPNSQLVSIPWLPIALMSVAIPLATAGMA